MTDSFNELINRVENMKKDLSQKIKKFEMK